MYKLKKSKGFSLYDILISLIIFVLVSVFITKIFVENIEVNKSNKVLDACTFEAIETIEQIKGISDGVSYTENKYLSNFSKEQTAEDVFYSRNFYIEDEVYKEEVHLKQIESYDTDNVRIATVSNNIVNSEITYDYTNSSLYEANIKIFDKNNNEVYNIKTNFTENHKVIK